MKIINKIALAELRNLFYSPVSWFLILAFYIINASFLFEWLGRMASGLDAGLEAVDNFTGKVDGILKSMNAEVTDGYFQYLHLFMALLTMGVINREMNAGSIKLLYSSPIRNREIILGKYWGIVLFSFIFLLGAAFLLVTSIVIVKASYSPEYLSIFISLFLLANFYAAIGLFFSSVTNYQIVAAVFTFLAFYLLNTITNYGQQNDLFRTVSEILSFKYKRIETTSGLISSKNLLYFILMIAMFLLFAMIRLRSVRVAIPRKITALHYVLVLSGTVLLIHAGSTPGWVLYKDLTKKQFNTLHPYTQEVLKNFDGSPLKVTLYVNLLQRFGNFGFPEKRFIYKAGLWDQYLRFYPNVQFDYVYYYAIKEGDSTLYKQYPGKNIDQIASLTAESYGVRRSLFKPGTSLDNFHELENEDFRAIMRVGYKEKQIYIRTIADGGAWPQQINMAGELMRLVRDSNVVVSFMTGNLERSPYRNTPRDFGAYTSKTFELSSLVDRGVDVDTVSAKETDIPDSVQLLVVADPKVEYTPIELERINQYIQRGGNAIFFVEPGKQFILNPVLKKIGVVAEDGMLIENSQLRHVVPGKLSDKALTMSKEMERFLLFPALGNGLNHNAATPLSYQAVDGFEVEPIIKTASNKKIWLKKGAYVADSVAPVFTKEDGDIQLEEYTLAVALRRKIGNKEQRIIVAGDADFMSNRAIDPKKLNHQFYSWGLNNQYPIFTFYPFCDDRYLKINRDQVEGMMIVYIYVIPGIVLFLAVALLLRRRKK
ncbi:MAG: Gldg family protein [Pseudobacter sp.]|uniref:Gldg family protein n=1 Tax=Pseudobacter sp. TaxID=2045420 RepID=UPI003F81F8B5